MQPDPTSLLDLIGLRPIFVDDLHDDAVVLWDDGRILLFSDLSKADLDDIVDQTLTLWAADLAASADGSGVER